MTDKRMTILQHLDELRRVLIVSLLSILPASAVGWIYRQEILDILTRPVERLNYKLVYISPTEAFMANITVALIGGIVLASPVISWQFWSFIMPALTRNERKYVVLVVPISILLFVTGVVFGYLTVFNFGITFLLGFGGEGLEPMLSLSKYLSFAFWFLIPFGIIFEMPLVIIFLTRLGIVTPEFLAKNRKFALLAIVAISAIATPTTDVVSQFAMAAPMYFLYEISIWISRILRIKAKPAEEVEEADELSESEPSDQEEITDEEENVENKDTEKQIEVIAEDEAAVSDEVISADEDDIRDAVATKDEVVATDEATIKDETDLKDDTEIGDPTALKPSGEVAGDGGEFWKLDNEKDDKTRRLEDIYNKITKG